MTRYHFSLGNSTEGPIGFCAVVDGASRTEATAKLKRALRNISGPSGDLGVSDPNRNVEYLNVYFNPTVIGLSDIDGAEPQGTQ